MNPPSGPELLRLRKYGDSGPPLLLLHGGPGVSGYLGPVGAALADSFRVYEPFQRGSGGERLTVARHVEDLRELIDALRLDEPPALLGHSWGAILALAFAAAHPERTGPLVLVSCAAFDERSRRLLAENRGRKTPIAIRRELMSVATAVADRDRRLRLETDLLLQVDSFDTTVTELGTVACDARAHDETWADALRLQKEGVHPAAFRAVASPVLMLHGAEDSLPGRLIYASLSPYVPRIRYREIGQCGHFPWLERAASEPFYTVLRGWLAERAHGGPEAALAATAGPPPAARAPSRGPAPGGAPAPMAAPAPRRADSDFLLQLSGERYAILRFQTSDPLPDWLGGTFWSVTQTRDEISVVCAASLLPPDVQGETGWRRIRVSGPLPLTAIGVLAALLDPLRDADVPVFVLSTHDTDYVFVPEDQLETAKQALGDAGHRLVELSS
jgi:alpha-beta hydrolase superfamily lysophospholipase